MKHLIATFLFLLSLLSCNSEKLIVPSFDVQMEGLIVHISNNSQGASSFLWDMGDGIKVERTENTFSHTYTHDGTYTITLVASNKDNKAEFQKIVVAKEKMVADFDLTVDGMTITIQNKSVKATDFLWYFGDNTYRNDSRASFKHTYSTGGTYSIELHASKGSESVKYTKEVAIEAIPYRLVWSDEFNGTAVDETKWNFEVTPGNYGNQEKQYYLKKNAEVRNGHLYITALKEASPDGYQYSSTRLNTKGKAFFTYGKVEARLKVPKGLGVWPAFWMLPEKTLTGVPNSNYWPGSGEIDIMEYAGNKPNFTSAALHTSKWNGMSYMQEGSAYFWHPVPNFQEEFQVVGIEWKAQSIDFYVVINGVESTFFRYPFHPDWKQYPFYEDFHILLNLAIGGVFNGNSTIDNSIFSETVNPQFVIDYVRVYQRKK